MVLPYQKKHQRLKHDSFLAGSITVEAAYVMPIIILILITFIYLAFYLHDICRITGEMELALHKAGVSFKHDATIKTGEVDYDEINDRGVFYRIFGSTKEKETRVNNYLKQELSEGLFLVKIKNIKVEDNKSKVTVSVVYHTKLSIPWIAKLFAPLSDQVISEE